MLSSDQPSQPDPLALEFSKALERMPYKPVLLALPANVHQEILDYSAQQQMPPSMVVAEAVSAYIEMQLITSQQTQEPVQEQRQRLAEVYEAACHHIWMVRRKIEQWKDIHAACMFWESVDLKKGKEESDRNAE